jgi:hypothetical protein
VPVQQTLSASQVSPAGQPPPSDAHASAQASPLAPLTQIEPPWHESVLPLQPGSASNQLQQSASAAARQVCDRCVEQCIKASARMGPLRACWDLGR